MAQNKVLQFEGDLRLWDINTSTSALTPVLADTSDIYGNIPIEASGTVFGYEAGDLVEVKSKRRDRYNQTIHSEQQPGTPSISLTLVAVPAALMARVFYGEAAEVNVTGSTVTDESVTFSASALTQQLDHTYLASSPAPVVTNSAGSTTYVAGTDYVIDTRLGRIRRIASGAIGATDTVLVDYTYQTFSLLRIRGGVAPQQSFYIEGDLKNRPDASDLKLTIYQANLATDGDVDLFSSEPLTVTLTGNLITPEDKTEPYVVDIITPPT